jgi:hypothetical protein
MGSIQPLGQLTRHEYVDQLGGAVAILVPRAGGGTEGVKDARLRLFGELGLPSISNPPN